MKNKSINLDKNAEEFIPNGWSNWEQFEDNVFEELPDIIKCVTNHFDTKVEKDSALFAMLVLCSGILPKYTTKYNKRIYEANLFGYLYGGFGSGKGVIPICKSIFKPIHERRMENAENRNSISKTRAPNKQGRNRNKVLFIPGNATKSALYHLLEDNMGRGIIVETEADTITTALKSEHGGFSDIFRAAFEHEELSMIRKLDGLKYISLPAISILLSSTPQQIKRLIVNVENGLFSRFVFYEVPSSKEFKNVFADEQSVFNEDEFISSMLEWLMEELLSNGGATFRFTKWQQKNFLSTFSMIKQTYHDEFEGELDGVVHRYGVIMTRIAMILTILRTLDCGTKVYSIKDEYVCSYRDFVLARSILTTLMVNTEKVFELINAVDVKNELSTEKLKMQIKNEERVLYYHRTLKMTHSQIAIKVFGKHTAKSKVHRILRKNGY